MANNMGSTLNAIAAAITEATDEMQRITEEMMRLQSQRQKCHERVTQLQQFIARGEGLLGKEPAGITSRYSGERWGSAPLRPSVAQYAEQVLQEFQRPVRVPEMADYLESRGLMQGKWTKEVLRTAMSRNTGIFERVAPGLYALKAWRLPVKKCRDAVSEMPIP